MIAGPAGVNPRSSAKERRPLEKQHRRGRGVVVFVLQPSDEAAGKGCSQEPQAEEAGSCSQEFSLSPKLEAAWAALHLVAAPSAPPEGLVSLLPHLQSVPERMAHTTPDITLHTCKVWPSRIR